MARKILSVNEVLRRAGKWDDKYLRVAIHAVELSDNDDERKDELIAEFLSYENRHAFKATNPHSKRLFLPAILDALVEEHGQARYDLTDIEDSGDGPGERKVVFALVTFTDVAWACSDRKIDFDLRRAKQKVRNALKRGDYLARFEAAHYVNEYHVVDGIKGNLVLFHCHALVWASSRSKLRRLRSRVHHRFRPVSWAKTGMRVQRLASVKEVPRVVGYISKMPGPGYKHLTNGTRHWQEHAEVRPGSQYRFFSHMREYSLFDFWFAGGEGKVPLRKARKRLEAMDRPALRVRRVGRPRPPAD